VRSSWTLNPLVLNLVGFTNFLYLRGFEPAKKPVPGTMTTTSQASPTSITHPPADTSPTPNAAGEREERQRRKAQRKEEKRARKEENKRLRILERESRHPRYAIDEGRGRGMRSRSRSRSRSRTPLPSRSRPSTNRRSASPRHRAFSSRRRPLSRSLSRSPPPRRPDSYRDTLASTHEPPARRRRRSFSRSSLGSSRSRTPPPRREDESQERRKLPTDGDDYHRGRQSPLRRDSDVRDQRGKGYYDRRR
jgi:hypothetical protein